MKLGIKISERGPRKGPPVPGTRMVPGHRFQREVRKRFYHVGVEVEAPFVEEPLGILTTAITTAPGEFGRRHVRVAGDGGAAGRQALDSEGDVAVPRDMVAPPDETGRESGPRQTREREAMEELSKILFGAVGGGLVATVFRLVDSRLDSRQKKKESAQATLERYAKPLWLAAHELEIRLEHVAHLKNRPALKFSPPQEHQLDWFTKYGYYVTSTAYVLSSVASWLGLFQRDVVFLDFGEDSQSVRFFRLIKDFRATLSQSILWYQYIDGIGSELVDGSARQPMTFSAFCRKLHQDQAFRLFYDQLFQFLNKIADGDYQDVLARTLDRLRGIMSFLSEAGVVPNLLGAVEPGI